MTALTLTVNICLNKTQLTHNKFCSANTLSILIYKIVES
jgi:hypothetical protein